MSTLFYTDSFLKFWDYNNIQYSGDVRSLVEKLIKDGGKMVMNEVGLFCQSRIVDDCAADDYSTPGFTVFFVQLFGMAVRVSLVLGFLILLLVRTVRIGSEFVDDYNIRSRPIFFHR